MKSFALAVLAASSAVSAARVCANEPTDEQVARVIEQYEEDAQRAPAPTAKPEIKVHYHVVQAGEALEQGNVPDSQIADQITVLNEDFANTGLTFKLVNTTRTTKKVWFNKAIPEGEGDSAEALAMKTALRQGGAATLNLYSVGFTAYQGLLGYATFPWDFKANKINDGVVFRFDTVPGGTAAPFDLGKTVSHEVGHWVGLWHTFQGGCAAPGDEVSDTPAEASPASGCPKNRDTCPGKKGKDPVNNYMDYSDDACLNTFSEGQVDRLTEQMTTYRGVKF